MILVPPSRRYVVCSRSDFAERRPYDGAWTWLAGSLTHATRLTTLADACAVALKMPEATEIWTLVADRVVARLPLT